MARVTPGQFARSVEHRVGLVVKYAGFDVWGRLTRTTPVRTGRARAGWNMARNRSDLSVPPEGASIPLPLPPVIGQVGDTDEIRVTNNVEYIGPLNDGHSRQAPQGFVDLAVQETRAALAGIVDDIKRQAERGA